MSSTQHISLSVSKRHVICSEILSVTSVMRKNSRWASTPQRPLYARDDSFAASLGLRRAGGSSDTSNGSTRREVQLMAGFLELKREVQNIENIDELPLTTLFSPFFDLIRSPLSTGPITSAALSGVHNFFVSGFVTADSPELEIALAELSNTVSHCKFEASDASGDEVALYRIMAVIEQCMCGAVSSKLGDVEVCEMLETVLTTCCQMRLSEILRRYAESTMHAIVRRIFQRLQVLDPDEEEKKLMVNDSDSSENELKMNVQTTQETSAISEATLSNGSHALPSVDQENIQEPIDSQDIKSLSTATTGVRSDYGLPSIIELFRVLINILDPNDRLHTDSTRLTALRILNTALESAGSHIGAYPSLMSLIQDHGCKYLFQLARSENSNVLYMSLRVISIMFETMHEHLKLQQELFLSFAIDRLVSTVPTRAQISLLNQSRGLLVASRPDSPAVETPADFEDENESAGIAKPAITPAKGEARELILETLSQMARHPSFMVDLYVNYDCDINCEDLFEKLIDFLTRGVYFMQSSGPREQSQQTSQILCLDLLLEFIQHMANRTSGHSQAWPKDYPDSGELIHSKSRKRLVLTGASRFNAKPKVGLSYLEENKLIYADLSDTIDRPRSLAIFLKNCTRLDKRLLGDYISKPENSDLLKAFISLFDFKDKLVAEAMREMLESFRLPGESQQIARITETFAEVYFSAKPADIKSQDAVYVLAYSIIMLNTDLHNPQVRKRMTLEDYQRNLRGVNDGSDFPPEFLNTIYESIRRREIVMPEEHSGQVGFGYAWKELLARTRLSGTYRSCNSSLFDLFMFKSTWKPIITAIAFAFITFDDDYTVQRAITGFRQLATLAGHFQLPEVFDYVVVSLSQVTSLIPDTLMTRVPHYPVVKVEGQGVTVSPLSIRFGTNFKGQLAAVVLFTIINGNGNAIREGWTQIFEIFQNLFLHSLLPIPMLQMEDFLDGSSIIPLHAKQPIPQRPGRGDGGLLSTLSSYLMTPYSSDAEVIPEATDSEIENTLCTIDCVSACKLDDLYSQITNLDVDALVAGIRALEALAHERTVARLKQELDDVAAPNSPNARSRGKSLQTLSYDPASVYLLETMVSIVSKTPHYIEETWQVVYEHLSALLSSAASYSVLLIERAVVSLWRLCLIIADKPALRDQVYLSLDLLGNLPSSVTSTVVEQVISGLVLLIRSHLDIIRSQTEWGLVFALLRTGIKHSAASRQSFDVLTGLISDGPQQCVTIDNFHGLVNLLDDYATAAGMVVEKSNIHDKKKTVDSPLEATIQRGKRSIDLLFELKNHIPLFETVSADQLWAQCTLPLISSLGRQATNPCRDVRHFALIHLQRILLGQNVVFDSTNGQTEIIFNRVIFPLIDELLKPQVFQRDPQGIPETRLRASALLCKAFMQFEVNNEAKQRDIRVLWIQILDLLDRLMNANKRDQLHEAVPETLKNVVLVMNALDILVPPSTPDRRDQRQLDLWKATEERIERFLPGFLEEIIPTPPSQTVEATTQPLASPS